MQVSADAHVILPYMRPSSSMLPTSNHGKKPTRQPTAQYVDFIVLYLQPAHGRMHVIELMELGHFIDELLDELLQQ